MAHNIATLNGINGIAYLDQTPWHGLGQRLNLTDVAPADRISAALTAAQLRFKVGSVPLLLSGSGQVVGSHKASVRFNEDGTIGATLGVVGSNYQHVQNEEACEVLQVLAQEFGCVPAAAGALGDGERCWLLMRLADTQVTVLPGDDVRGYFLLTWDHTGNMAISLLGTPVRVVCQNTLNLATNGRKAWIAIKHTTSAPQRLDEAAGIVRKLMQALAVTGDTFASLATKVLSAAELDAYIAAAIPNTDPRSQVVSPVIVARRDTVAKLVFYGRGATLANQHVDTRDGSASLWAAYNGITEYVDHVRTAEAQSDSGLRRAQESAIWGANAEIKSGALQLARELVAA